jgi:Holin of 3TMs, for gene-transfer release
MGLLERLIGGLFGSGRTRLDELGAMLATRIAEQGGGAALGLDPRAATQFDRAMDGLNRLPRPLMALGTVALMAAAIIDPVWFSARMDALSQMPEPAWWLIGAVVSLYFGGRLQAHDQKFQRELLQAMARLKGDHTPQ